MKHCDIFQKYNLSMESGYPPSERGSYVDLTEHSDDKTPTGGQMLTQSSNQAAGTREQTSEPHMCIICCKSLSTAGNLKQHMLTHTGVKPQKCS